MHIKAYTSSRTATRIHRVPLSPQPLEEQVRHHVPEPRVKPVLPDIQERMHLLVRNPLFLVVVTWLVMAGLLVMEIVGGK